MIDVPTVTGNPDPVVTDDLGPLKYAGAVKTHKLDWSPAAWGMKVSEASETGKVLLLSPFKRVDIVIDGIDRSGPSFEVRVFGNNAAATATTEMKIESGYLGSFHVFGHGLCFGDAGHCEVNDRGVAETDLRDPHPLVPVQKVLVATDGIKSLIARDGALREVSLVPIAVGKIPQGSDEAKARDILKYNNVRVVTYD
jgi:hypothetical protein